MKGLEIGQVLSLRIRFNNSGTVSKGKHPYLIVDIDEELGAVEIAQIDSLAGKEYKAAMRSNKIIFCDDPKESVIDRDSYVQLDNTLQVEDCVELLRYRRQTDKLSEGKLKSVLTAYRRYHEKNRISEDKQVFMNREEITRLQK